jgi:hypothetical protein
MSSQDLSVFETNPKGVNELKEELEMYIFMSMEEIREFCVEAGPTLFDALANIKLGEKELQLRVEKENRGLPRATGTTSSTQTKEGGMVREAQTQPADDARTSFGSVGESDVANKGSIRSSLCPLVLFGESLSFSIFKFTLSITICPHQHLFSFFCVVKLEPHYVRFCVY